MAVFTWLYVYVELHTHPKENFKRSFKIFFFSLKNLTPATSPGMTQPSLESAHSWKSMGRLRKPAQFFEKLISALLSGGPLEFANGNLTTGMSQDAAKPQRALSQAPAEKLAAALLEIQAPRPAPGSELNLGLFFNKVPRDCQVRASLGHSPALSNNPDMKEVNT